MTARRVSLWVAGTILLVTSTVSFLDADEPARRRSGPRDWSHRHIIAGAGTDNTAVIGDWRAVRRQIHLEAVARRGSAVGSWNEGHHRGGNHTGEEKANWAILTGGRVPP